MIRCAVVYSPNGDYREYEVGELLDDNLVLENIHDSIVDGVPVLIMDAVNNNGTPCYGYLKVVGLPFITINE